MKCLHMIIFLDHFKAGSRPQEALLPPAKQARATEFNEGSRPHEALLPPALQVSDLLTVGGNAHWGHGPFSKGR